MNKDHVTIHVRSGETASAVAGALLAIAVDKMDVRTVLGGTAFRVPPEVAREYLEGAPAKPVRRTRKKASAEETKGESA